MAGGHLLYEGTSQLDGSPIVCIATGINGQSANHKTGPMVQTWILPRDVSPEVAVATGEDRAVCGSCVLRGIVKRLPNGEQVNRFRGCYVFVGQAPQKVWESYKSGHYVHGIPDMRSKHVRIGSYGDPCAVPLTIWSDLAAVAAGWTGYTHQWTDARFRDYRHLLMASVESDMQAEDARRMGWRWFRLAPTGTPPSVGEFHCPASAEEGYRKTCQDCGACDGANGNQARRSVVIWPHGPPAAVKSYYRTAMNLPSEIDHRKTLTALDSQLLSSLHESGRTSARVLAGMTGRGAQSVATRLWHLRQMGYVRRVSRGQYEAIH